MKKARSLSKQAHAGPRTYPIEKIRPFGDDLDHPEGVAVGPDGTVYAGGELGQIYRISADGSKTEHIASTGGFSLGITLDREGNLFVCNHQLHAVLRVDPAGRVSRFAERAGERPFQTPNFSVFDAEGNLYVSDSGQFKHNNGLIYRIRADGRASVFHPGPFAFANGLALNASKDALFVIESNRDCVTRVEIKPDGTAGDRSVYCGVRVLLPPPLHPRNPLDFVFFIIIYPE